jgi:capsular exopolysaccharide synthesis family protein
MDSRVSERQLPARAAALPAVHLEQSLANYDPLIGEPIYRPLFDTRHILHVIFRNRWLICGTLAFSLMLGLLAILLMPSMYRATARIAILQESDSPLGDVGSKVPRAAETSDVERGLQTQVDLLGTRDMAKAVLRRLAAAGGAPARVADRFSPKRMQRYLSVTLPRNSRIIPIAFRDTDRRVAALIANTYAEALIAYNLQAHYNASAYAREFLGKQLGVVKLRLEQSDRDLLAYARSAGLLDVSDGTFDGGNAGAGQSTSGRSVKSLTTSNLVQLNSAYSQAEAARIQAQQKWQQSISTPIMSLPDVLTNDSIQKLNQQKAALQAKLSEDQLRYGDSYPPLQQTKANIAELERQIASIAASVKNSIRNQYEVATRQENAFASGVGRLKGETMAEQDRLVRYNILQRERDTNRELYDGLLQRFKQVSAEAGAAANNISVVDRAYPPEHRISPNPIKYMSLAFVLGSILAFVLVFLRERLDNRVSDPEWIDREITTPFFGMIPRVEGGVASEAILQPNSAMSEACHSLRTSVEQHYMGETPSSIMLTSSKLQEGKSTTSLGLAHSFADAGDRVLLIDGDLRRPSLHTFVGLENDRGFADVLAGTVSLRDAVVRSDLFNLDLLLSGPRPENPVKLLNGDRVREILADALTSYDRIVVDGPPTLGIADASRLSASVDATIFVVKNQGVTKDEVMFALRRLRADQATVIGAILTMFEPRRAGKWYPYSYSYGELAAA